MEPELPQSIEAALVWLGALVVVGTFVRQVVLPTWRVMRETAESVAALARVAERELSRNGGESLKDRLDQTTHAVEDIRHTLKEHVRSEEDQHRAMWDAIRAIQDDG